MTVPSFPPALGFETSRWNAAPFYNALLRNAGKWGPADCVLLSNGSKLAGYLPIASTLVGLLRMAGALVIPKSVLGNKRAHFLRGAVEFLGLAPFLLLLADLLATWRGEAQARYGGGKPRLRP